LVTTAPSNASAPAAALCRCPSPLSLSSLVVVCSSSLLCSLALVRRRGVVVLGELGFSTRFIFFPFLFPPQFFFFLSPPTPFPSSVCFGSSELETGQASEIENCWSGHRPAHLKLRWILSTLHSHCLYARTSFSVSISLFSPLAWLIG
jgi:hypothetical protein